MGYFFFFMFMFLFKCETIVSKNGLSLGYSEQDTSSVPGYVPLEIFLSYSRIWMLASSQTITHHFECPAHRICLQISHLMMTTQDEADKLLGNSTSMIQAICFYNFGLVWFGDHNFDCLLLFCLGRTVKHCFGWSLVFGQISKCVGMLKGMQISSNKSSNPMMLAMAIQVVEFSNSVYKIRKIFA